MGIIRDTPSSFKAGDIVRLISTNASYNYTNRDALCKVLQVKPSGDLEVYVVARRDARPITKNNYVVAANQFYVATNEEIKEFGLAVPQGEKKMKFFNQVSDYVEKHKDILFTVALVLVLDHYVFDGKFKSKIEDLVSGFLSKHAPTLPTGGTPAA